MAYFTVPEQQAVTADFIRHLSEGSDLKHATQVERTDEFVRMCQDGGPISIGYVAKWLETSPEHVDLIFQRAIASDPPALVHERDYLRTPQGQYVLLPSGFQKICLESSTPNGALARSLLTTTYVGYREAFQEADSRRRDLDRDQKLDPDRPDITEPQDLFSRVNGNVVFIMPVNGTNGEVNRIEPTTNVRVRSSYLRYTDPFVDRIAATIPIDRPEFAAESTHYVLKQFHEPIESNYDYALPTEEVSEIATRLSQIHYKMLHDLRQLHRQRMRQRRQSHHADE